MSDEISQKSRHVKRYLPFINPFDVETGIISENNFNTMFVDAMAPCVAI